MIAESHRLAVAPMMDWTDRHCRFFHRQLAPKAMLYTEMVTADAVIHGDRDRLLGGHHMPQHETVSGDDAVVLQLGGSDPQRLAEAVRYATDYNYAEYNLNIGCPSDRVQHGRFGACLMAEPALVAELVAAMREAAGSKPVTVKCRIGIDDMDSEAGLDDFIDRVAAAGVGHFIIHARKAWLSGLSPKQNRDIPPLDYDRVRRLALRRQDLAFSLNGGLDSIEAVEAVVPQYAGVMLGRAAYRQPWLLAMLSSRIHDVAPLSRQQVVTAMAAYAEVQCRHGEKLGRITRHMLGLMNGLAGAREYRRMLGDDARDPAATPALLLEAAKHVENQQHKDAA